MSPSASSIAQGSDSYLLKAWTSSRRMVIDSATAAQPRELRSAAQCAQRWHSGRLSSCTALTTLSRNLRAPLGLQQWSRARSLEPGSSQLVFEN